jgi:dihydroorotase
MATLVRGVVMRRDDEIVAEGRGEPARFLETLAGQV